MVLEIEIEGKPQTSKEQNGEEKTFDHSKCGERDPFFRAEISKSHLEGWIKPGPSA
ncbi:hypothetical protein BEST7613_4649 [Synechocystis sp. PCC 6803]|nr:hypothetical protein BEST7613_4649 [Synechocystis sp. PCC 6803] [Bacillus subtilis BEST7613]